MPPLKQEIQTSPALNCQEESLGVELGEKCFEFEEKETFLPLNHDELIMSLLSKQKENPFCYNPNLVLDKDFIFPRKEAVDWILKVSAHFGFQSLTVTLAVNYLDRFISSPKFQINKPWMMHLATVSCLSLAAKVEETHVPLLLDLQVEESKYVFEAKTIQRMELLVLSCLEWRMHPVTPIPFFHHILSRLGLSSNLHCEFLSMCEELLLGVISDSRIFGYLPSTLAAAVMLHVIKEIESLNHQEHQDQVMSLLKITEDEVKECYKFIVEVSRCFESRGLKRKRLWIPSSQNGVIDVSFSSDVSNDLLVLTQPVSSSPEPRFKRSKAPDQQMRLPTPKRMFVEVISRYH